MVSIIVVGKPILEFFGPTKFLLTYFGGALLGSLVHLKFYGGLLNKPETPEQIFYSKNASYFSSQASSATLLTLLLVMQPSYPFALKLPAWALSASLLSFQIYISDIGNHSWVGNLGGITFGLALGFLTKRKFNNK